MAITLGGITLNGSLQWTNRFAYANVAANVQRTLGGTPVIFTAPLTKGQPILLEATLDGFEGTGWFSKTMIDAIITLADDASGQHTFNFHGEIHTVMFDYSDPPPYEFIPLIPKIPFDADSQFYGTLNLITV